MSTSDDAADALRQLGEELASLPPEKADALADLADKLGDALKRDQAAGQFARVTRDVCVGHAKALLELLELPELTEEDWAVAFVITRCTGIPC